jgi:hypothetical protein
MTDYCILFEELMSLIDVSFPCRYCSSCAIPLLVGALLLLILFRNYPSTAPNPTSFSVKGGFRAGMSTCA